MKVIINLKIAFFILFFLTGKQTTFAQDYSQDANVFFGRYLDSKSQFDLAKKSLPTMEECNLIFKDKSALKFFEYIEELRKNFNSNQPKIETYKECLIDSFLINNIGKESKELENVKDQIQPNLTFYQVKYYREKGDNFYTSYSYFVNIRGRWVLLPDVKKGLKQN